MVEFEDFFQALNGSCYTKMANRKSGTFMQHSRLCIYWQKYVHEVLVNRLGGLSLPRKSVVRLTDCTDMTLDVYRGCKTTMQQQQSLMCLKNLQI